MNVDDAKNFMKGMVTGLKRSDKGHIVITVRIEKTGEVYMRQGIGPIEVVRPKRKRVETR